MYDLNALNGTNMADVYVGISGQLPILFPMILVFEFLLILVVGSMANKKSVGFSNVITWCAISGLVTTTSAFMYSAVTGIINLYVLTTCVVITIGFVAIYFFTDMD